MNPKVDIYFVDGCGRCELYQTPQCKVHSWTEPMQYLRDLLLKSELKEDFKWSQPCYTLDGKNVMMLTALKDFCCISFFKGSLMKDPHKLLIAPGKNSQADRYLKYTSTQQVIVQKDIIVDYIKEAIELEKSGARVDFKEKNELVFPEELIQKMNEDSKFKKAFSALSPGRQRGWNLHFSSAKQSSTRLSRIEKARPKILEGKGWNEY